MNLETGPDARPIVLVTGARGNIGRALAQRLATHYRVVGLDLHDATGPQPVFAADFANPASIELALMRVRERYGNHLASVVHLVAYYDFSGDDDPRYRSVNVDGTAQLLRALQSFEVEQFVYASTMLVHAPCRPGERIDEDAPIAPRWAYPRSKAAAEEALWAERGRIPVLSLRLAGVYDQTNVVPTLAQQIARVYERSIDSFFYSGSELVGQAMLHRDDMLDAFVRAIERRGTLPETLALLIGEPDTLGYDALQDELGRLLHGRSDWPTIELPKPLAAAGVWAQAKLEAVVPDALDAGRKPFVRPFMTRLADDHYALNVERARQFLGWQPRHRFVDELPAIVDELRRDPLGWYRRNGVAPSAALQEVAGVPDIAALRAQDRQRRQAQLAENRWPHFINIALGSWLLTQPLLLNVQEPWLRASEMTLGALLMVFAALALSERGTAARWICAGIGAIVMAVPFLFHTTSAAAYASDSLLGALIFGFAVCLKPEPGVAPQAALHGPDVPPGWSYNPSDWTQRVQIIVMALIGLFVARYLAGYQLGHLPAVWDPFFAGSPIDPKNGTEEVITSHVSKAWPVSDAAVGGYTYLLEIVTALVGARARWRTMPWLVVLFGLMIAPLGITSIFFIIIQPIVIGTWSTIALIGAAAILVQIPYSVDEIIATVQFLRRRAAAGRNWVRVFFRGDTDEMPAEAGAPAARDEFARAPRAVLADIFGGGVGLPWNLALAALVGLLLMFTRPLAGVDGNLAHAHHVVGALALTVVSIACAEVARAVRLLNVPLGVAAACLPFVVASSTAGTVVSIVAGLALAALSLRRGPIRERYAGFERYML